MSKRRYILLTFMLAACSGPDAPDADVGVDPQPDGGSSSTAMVEEGLYVGTADDEDAALAVWSADEAMSGRLLVGEDLGFELRLGASPTLVPLDGACASCAAGPWDIQINEVGRELQIVVIDDVGPGFVDLRLLPSDGFKPEFAPGPEVELWAGEALAISTTIGDEPTLRSTCEIGVSRATGEIDSFSCQQVRSDSPWTDEVADSWSSDETGASFETTGARYEGVFTGDPSFEMFEGTIRVAGEVVGVFELVKLSP